MNHWKFPVAIEVLNWRHVAHVSEWWQLVRLCSIVRDRLRVSCVKAGLCQDLRPMGAPRAGLTAEPGLGHSRGAWATARLRSPRSPWVSSGAVQPPGSMQLAWKHPGQGDTGTLYPLCFLRKRVHSWNMKLPLESPGLGSHWRSVSDGGAGWPPAVPKGVSPSVWREMWHQTATSSCMKKQRTLMQITTKFSVKPELLNLLASNSSISYLYDLKDKCIKQHCTSMLMGTQCIKI